MADIAQRGNKLTKKDIRKHFEEVREAFPEDFKRKKRARTRKMGGGRTNLLEELGRVEAEPSNRNRRAEISRVHGELNRGYATGGRVGLKKGGKPWGTGPKPGSHEFMMQNLHKRKGKAKGGAIKAARIFGKKFKKKKVYPETEDLTHQVGPYVGDVGSEGKRRKLGPRGRGKSPGRPQAPGPKGTPAPKFGPGKPRDPREPKKFGPGKPRDPREPKKYQPAATGGRIGLKKGGSDKKWIQKAVNPKHKGYCTPMTKKTCTPARKALARTFKKKAKTGW